jgi:hypothetical protein
MVLQLELLAKMDWMKSTVNGPNFRHISICMENNGGVKTQLISVTIGMSSKDKLFGPNLTTRLIE